MVDCLACAASKNLAFVSNVHLELVSFNVLSHQSLVYFTYSSLVLLKWRFLPDVLLFTRSLLTAWLSSSGNRSGAIQSVVDTDFCLGMAVVWMGLPLECCSSRVGDP
jgi:hypothetical protein